MGKLFYYFYENCKKCEIRIKQQPEKIDEMNDDEYKKQYDQYKEVMQTAESAFITRIKDLLEKKVR